MRVIDRGTELLVRSPAKLNLFLAVHGRRPDGFHELETLMVRLSLADAIRIRPRNDGRITLRLRPVEPTEAAPIPAGPTNLVWQAAELLRTRCGVEQGADLVLEKRIPAEAGLAGGSGNAAAALAALNCLWRLGRTRAELAPLAAELGSDVPFFFGGGAAIATGRGERLSPAAVGPLHFVLVKPAFGLSTAAVFGALAAPPLTETAEPGDAWELAAWLRSGRLAEAAARLRNDLQAPAEAIAPAVAVLRRRIAEVCRFGALMTGSGSACFGLCGSAREAIAAAARLRAGGAGRVYAVSTA